MALSIGCSHKQSQAEHTPGSAARFIIKFVDTARSPPGVIRMQAASGALIPLRYDRAMSGDAHLYKGRLTQEQAKTIVQRLNNLPDVRYAEVDRRVQLWKAPTDNK
jgi:hypothetical protein